MKKKGFTMIELSLALVFISVLLLTTAIVIYNITTLYQKGLTMRAINSAGRELVDDISRSISASPSMNLTSYCSEYTPGTNAYNQCMNNNALKYVYQQSTYKLDVDNDGKLEDVPTFGAFCTGRHSYIWNTGYAINARSRYGYTGPQALTATYNGKSDFRLLKVLDTNRDVCLNHMANRTSGAKNYYGVDNNLKTYTGPSTDVEELLKSSEADLVLYDMSIFSPTQHGLTLHSFYSGTFILATLNGSVDITGTGDFCTDPPDGISSDFTYCAINKFNFAMRAEGQVAR